MSIYPAVTSNIKKNSSGDSIEVTDMAETRERKSFTDSSKCRTIDNVHVDNALLDSSKSSPLGGVGASPKATDGGRKRRNGKVKDKKKKKKGAKINDGKPKEREQLENLKVAKTNPGDEKETPHSATGCVGCFGFIGLRFAAIREWYNLKRNRVVQINENKDGYCELGSKGSGSMVTMVGSRPQSPVFPNKSRTGHILGTGDVTRMIIDGDSKAENISTDGRHKNISYKLEFEIAKPRRLPPLCLKQRNKVAALDVFAVEAKQKRADERRRAAVERKRAKAIAMRQHAYESKLKAKVDVAGDQEK